MWRELGLAAVSGGVVGGALVSVESILAGAAESRSKHEALLAQLSTTTDLNGIDLSGQNLGSVYLPGRALVAAQMENVMLDGAKLLFGDLRHANLRGASLREADLSGSTLAFADLRDADLRSAVLRDVDLRDAKLDGADLRGAVLANGRLERSTLHDSRLDGTHVVNSCLQGARLERASVELALMDMNEYDLATQWPEGYVPALSTTVRQEPIAQMDLPTYLASRANRT